MFPSVVSVAGPGVGLIEIWSTRIAGAVAARNRRTVGGRSDASPTTSKVYWVKSEIDVGLAPECARRPSRR